MVGRPNAGKSSLFNALVGATRAIVTDLPGTTRDVVAERVDVGGMPVTLVDTAGLREARDVVEAEGIRRSRAAVAVASLTLEVVDASSASTESGVDGTGGAKAIVVWNKVDLLTEEVRTSLEARGVGVLVSALGGAGVAELRARISEALGGSEALRDTPAVSNIRHIRLLEEAAEAVELGRAAAAREGAEEIVLAELAPARAALEAVTGRRTEEDLLRHIFSTFCIGK